MKLVGHSHFSFQIEFVWPEVISKFEKRYAVLNKPKFHTNALLLTFYLFIAFQRH